MARLSSGWSRSAMISTPLTERRNDERAMPHVIVKLWPGKSEEQKRRLAQAITKDIATVLNYGDESVSVAMEEVSPAEWSERVYRPDIVEKAATLYKKPRNRRRATSCIQREGSESDRLPGHHPR